MGMSDKQFNAYNRQLLNQLIDVLNELPENEENEKAKQKLEKIADSLQKELED